MFLHDYLINIVFPLFRWLQLNSSSLQFDHDPPVPWTRRTTRSKLPPRLLWYLPISVLEVWRLGWGRCRWQASHCERTTSLPQVYRSDRVLASVTWESIRKVRLIKEAFMIQGLAFNFFLKKCAVFLYRNIIFIFNNLIWSVRK